MSWNYRIMKNEHGYSLREVFYENKKPVGWSDSTSRYYENVEDLINDYELQAKDAQKYRNRVLNQDILENDLKTLRK